MSEKVHFHRARNPDSEKYDSTRIPTRPLGEFSTFITTQLPHLLAGIRDGSYTHQDLEENIDSLLPSVESTRLLVGADLKTARLDAQFAYNALVHAARLENKKNNTSIPYVPGTHISALAGELAQRTGRPRILTYEDVVIDNPVQDMRTFGSGTIGDSERGFYHAHLLIEQRLQVTIELMMGLIARLEQGDYESDDQIAAATKMNEHWRAVNLHTSNLRDDLPASDFLIFRDYLGSYIDPDTIGNGDVKLSGASGQGSSRLRATDFLLGGDTLIGNERFMNDTKSLLPYYPVSDIDQFRRTLQMAYEGRTLHRLMQGVDRSSKLHSLINKFAGLKVGWRHLHHRAVQRQMPDVVEGTGGTQLEEYLAMCIDATKHSYHG